MLGLNHVLLAGTVTRVDFGMTVEGVSIINFELLVKDRMHDQSIHIEAFICTLAGSGAAKLRTVAVEGEKLMVSGALRTRTTSNRFSDRAQIARVFIREYSRIEE